jgi:hypothetical protein
MPQPFGTGKIISDDSLQSLIFTLKNPHNMKPMKFALKENAEEKAEAIGCRL